EFTYSNGTIIPSWLENYTSSHAIWWVKLASYGSQTIFMDFAPASTNLFNTLNDGEAPQLSSSYGEYDDGANVFNFYSDFKGTALDTTKWSVASGVPFNLNNYIQFYNLADYNEFVISSKASFSNLSIFGTYSQFYTNVTTNCPYLFWGNSGGDNYKVIRIGGGDCNVHFAGYPESHFDTPYSAYLSTEPELFYLIPINSTYVKGYYNNMYLGTYYYDYSPGSSSELNINLYIGNGIDSAQFVKTYYIFVGSPVPGGVMPSVSFGSVS
ncbi:DUF2341 domain-containing protein, partial [Candidatus Parvarchaeota archaeon]|nr:DUF2341 domain-containing protein [Candidatus Parvarchaeota archaeon]